jgi:hypothetical protein
MISWAWNSSTAVQRWILNSRETMRSLCNSSASNGRRTWEVEWDWRNTTEDWGGTLNPIIAITGAHCRSRCIGSLISGNLRDANQSPTSSVAYTYCRPRLKKCLFPVFSPSANFSLLKNPPFEKGGSQRNCSSSRVRPLPGYRQTDPFPCRCWIRNEIIPFLVPLCFLLEECLLPWTQNKCFSPQILPHVMLTLG